MYRVKISSPAHGHGDELHYRWFSSLHEAGAFAIELRRAERPASKPPKQGLLRIQGQLEFLAKVQDQGRVPWEELQGASWPRWRKMHYFVTATSFGAYGYIEPFLFIPGEDGPSDEAGAVILLNSSWAGATRGISAGIGSPGRLRGCTLWPLETPLCLCRGGA
jgi:hypothetical protein